MKIQAQTKIKYTMGAVVRGEDGYTLNFSADDSLRSWWAIVRWNFHYRHWRPLLTANMPHLFTKVLRRKLWRRFA